LRPVIPRAVATLSQQVRESGPRNFRHTPSSNPLRSATLPEPKILRWLPAAIEAQRLQASTANLRTATLHQRPETLSLRPFFSKAPDCGDLVWSLQVIDAHVLICRMPRQFGIKFRRAEATVIESQRIKSPARLNSSRLPCLASVSTPHPPRA
jgi:hypothetical protein